MNVRPRLLPLLLLGLGCATTPTETTPVEDVCPDWSALSGGQIQADLDGAPWSAERANFTVEDGVLELASRAGLIDVLLYAALTDDGRTAEDVIADGDFPAEFPFTRADEPDAEAWALIYDQSPYESQQSAGRLRLEDLDGSGRLSGCFEVSVRASNGALHEFTNGLFRLRENLAED